MVETYTSAVKREQTSNDPLNTTLGHQLKWREVAK